MLKQKQKKEICKIFSSSYNYLIVLLIILNINYVFSQTFSQQQQQFSQQPFQPNQFNQQGLQTNPSYSSYDNNYYYDRYSNSDKNYDYNRGGSYNPSRNIQYTDPRFQTSSYGGYGLSGLYGYGSYNNQYGFSPEMCSNRQDFIIHVAPQGCSPALVRSDLLEEQNVPVFCKLMSFQANPLLSGTRIRSLHIKGQAPKGVSGISYLPSRTAITRNRDFVTTPVNDNLGHLVVVLAQQFNESSMPDFVEGNITAVIDYDSSGVFGVGKTNFYLKEMSEEKWQNDYRENGFWNGKAYARADSIEPDRATITIYRNLNVRESTVTLRKGETSRDIFLGGFYCAAGMRIRLDEIGAPVESALLQINDQQVWVSKGDRIIDDKCRITSINTVGRGGKITVSCPGNNFELSLIFGKAVLEIDGISRDVKINERIKENIYLGYTGTDKDGEIAVLVRDPFSATEFEFSDKGISDIVEKTDKTKQAIENEIKNQYKKKLKNIGDKINRLEIDVVRTGQEAFGIKLSETFVAKDLSPDNPNYNLLAQEYYDLAIKYYQDLFDLYPHEKIAEGQDPFAVQGLFDAARLSLSFGMNEKAEKLFNLLIENYPGTNFAERAKYERNLLFKYDRTNSKKVVEINKLQYSIDLLEFKKPSTKEAGAVFLINGEETILGLNDLKTVENVNIKLTKIEPASVSISYDFFENEKKISRTERLILPEKNQINVKGVNIKLVNVNLEKQAKIIITPNTYGTRTETNFHIKIGIEKRAIKLSPEKTKEVMENLKKAINDWNEINRKLGNVIKVLKGACFATSAILTVKNLFDGYTGSSLARNRLMTVAGGWNDKCEELVSQKLYTSLQQCLLSKNNEIEKDVKIYSEEIQKTNSIMKDIQNQVGIKRTDVLDFQGQTDAKKVEELFKQRFDSYCKNIKDKVTLPGADKQEVSFSEICNWDSMTHEQRREIMTVYNLKNSGGSEVLEGFVNKELGRVALESKNLHDLNIARIKSDELNKKYDLGVKTTIPVGDSITYGNIKRISSSDKTHNIYSNFEKGDSVVRVYVPSKKSIGLSDAFTAHQEVAGKEVIVRIKEIQGSAGTYTPNSDAKIYTIEGNSLSDEAKRSVLDYLSLAGMNKIKEASFKAYQNQMIDKNLRVKYFERAPYRGLPSEIPFDVDEGWYVKMNYVLSGFGTPYDESGRVVNFYICNVGGNGLIEFKKSGDDICRYYNGHSNELNFPGMTSAESSLLVQKAQRAIEEATRQYGQQKVIVNGRSFESGISFGDEEGQCTDFMSAADCNIMFNVCDPVICPASRCDLGGRYRVDNVVQTGIVGSLALCLPNIQEGIAVPICLTGVHAGLDGYISILNSTVACLNESLQTGRNIGICDEIKSVYLCDFFWKQATPFLDVLLERSFEVILGQGVRGGGEYLTVRSAWENTRKSVDFFKNQYAVNSIKAFYGRSTEAIGGSVEAEFCKAFISSGFVGASTSVFEALIEPDSPEQYHAWFSENPLTTATVPPISHYKVYFHIFAGKDYGAFYSLYLRDAPTTPGIHSTGIFMVDRGFVPRGSQVDKARDFTAASGFKQLCININGREECGFGKVSTSYALNALSDAYAQEQLKTGIVSEKECIAGTPSFYSLAQPNIQAGVEDVINPQLYNQGIVRICATENPGKQVLPTGEYDRTNSTYDRWKQVGYCDDPTIKCWLDTNSVKQVIRDKGIEEQVLERTNLGVLGADNYILPEESEAVLSEAEDFINTLTIDSPNKISIENKISVIVSKLERLTNIGANNVYRARSFFLLGRLHKKIALAVLESSQITTQLITDQTSIIQTETEEINKIVSEEVTDDMLKQNILIRTIISDERDVIEEFSYRYNETWLTNDRSFNKDLSYVEGVKIIVEKLGPYGEVYVNGKLVENKFNSVIDTLRKN
ncbi:MAG: hypothetical protein AABW90_02280 [Nanoarchaeota archaeon]